MVEQYVPDEFRDELDLPGSGDINSGALHAATADLATRKRHAALYGQELKQYAAKIKAHKGDKKKVAWYNKQVAAIKKQQATNVTKQDAAQNKVYETSGQYDKLLSGKNRDAYMALKSLFHGFGLDSLAGKIFGYVKQGYGADTISLLLQDTKEYKERFKGNETRRAAGLNVLSPAEYLSVEQSYRQILQDAGLPKGFYDNPADFQHWISRDVSPTELKGRVDVASQWVSQTNPETRQALALMYGIDEAHLTAYALDSARALPVLQKQSAAAQFGAEALRRGLVTDRGRLEGYVSSGLSQSSASEGFQKVAEELPNLMAISQRFGETFSQAEEEAAVFYGGNPQDKKRGRLASQERALFGGSRGSSAGGLSAGYSQT